MHARLQTIQLKDVIGLLTFYFQDAVEITLANALKRSAYLLFTYNAVDTFY